MDQNLELVNKILLSKKLDEDFIKQIAEKCDL